MRKVLWIATLLAVSGPAAAGNGFFMGGMADGMRDAQELELQRRALDLDRRQYRGSYDDYETRQLRRAVEENNRLREQQQILDIINRR